MKTVAEIRLDNLLLLVGEFGTQDKVAELADTSPVYLSQLVNLARDSKTGSTRGIGDALARKLEQGCGKERGWLDHPQQPHTYSPKIAAVLSIMERMNATQLDTAYKILDAIVEPHTEPAKRSNGS